MEYIVYSRESLGAAVKDKRAELKISQSQVGKSVKIDQVRISNIETGSSDTRLSTILKLLAALNLELIIRDKKQTQSNEDW